MKKLGKLTLFMLILLSISISTAYANTNKEEEQSEEELWISEYATDENSSKGTVIENVDKDGKPIDVEKEAFIEVRQFVSFKTKSGKTLHLIIDHSKNYKNVRLLTEVSELDLLNMLEEDERKKFLDEDKKEPVKKESEKAEEKTETTDKDKKNISVEEKSSRLIYFIVGIILLGVIGAGYYFKIYKNKKDDFEDDKEDYDELEEDDFETDVDDDALKELADDEIEVDNEEEED